MLVVRLGCLVCGEVVWGADVAEPRDERDQPVVSYEVVCDDCAAEWEQR